MDLALELLQEISWHQLEKRRFFIASFYSEMFFEKTAYKNLVDLY